jgi:hypothetical protein
MENFTTVCCICTCSCMPTCRLRWCSVWSHISASDVSYVASTHVGNQITSQFCFICLCNLTKYFLFLKKNTVLSGLRPLVHDIQCNSNPPTKLTHPWCHTTTRAPAVVRWAKTPSYIANATAAMTKHLTVNAVRSLAPLCSPARAWVPFDSHMKRG